MSMHNDTLKQLSDKLANKDISSVELTQHCIDRVNRYDDKLNTFITLDEEFALAQAKAADARIAKGEANAMTGLPIAQKDIFCAKGMKTTCASKMLDNFIAPYDATLITQFNNAGCVLFGKTNMDEFAMGSSNENSFYGDCQNPWDLDCVPGGSSGGSASAVAARLVPASTGTDTGGSIRQPAAFCGITGLKPTYGRVSRYGMIAFASSLDQAGPMAQTAEDAAMMMNVMAGFDPKDSTSVNRPVEDFTAKLNHPLKGLTIGLPKEYFVEALNPEIARVLHEAAKVLESLGVTLKDMSLPHTDMGIPVYYVIGPAECSSNLSRFDGVRYGYRCENPVDLDDLYCRSRGEGFGPEVKRRIMMGTYALSSGFYDAYYTKAQKVRRMMKQDFVEAFKTVDYILCPSTPSTAFREGEKCDDPISMYLADVFTVAANMAGLPALSMPAGFVKGLPVGAQLIGNYFDEAGMLNVAHQYQQATDWHTKIPEMFL